MFSGCVRLTYVPDDLEVDLDVLLNGKNLYHTSLSGKTFQTAVHACAQHFHFQ
jgi:hypothetical protein